MVRWQSPEVHDIWVDSIRFIKHNYDSMGHPVRSSDPRICGPHCGAQAFHPSILRVLSISNRPPQDPKTPSPTIRVAPKRSDLSERTSSLTATYAPSWH